MYKKVEREDKHMENNELIKEEKNIKVFTIRNILRFFSLLCIILIVFRAEGRSKRFKGGFSWSIIYERQIQRFISDSFVMPHNTDACFCIIVYKKNSG